LTDYRIAVSCSGRRFFAPNRLENVMGERNFLITVFVLGLAAPIVVFAGRSTLAPDGCTILAVSVSMAVRQAALGQNPVRPGARVQLAPASGNSAAVPEGAKSCRNTTRVTTGAFSATFAELGLPVSWGNMPSDSEDHCASRYLSECNPYTPGFFPAKSASYFRLVNDTWKAVGKSVSGFMPYGESSDLSHFEQKSLQLSMLGAVAIYVDAGESIRVQPGIGREETIWIHP
jgi:hypothetical protein